MPISLLHHVAFEAVVEHEDRRSRGRASERKRSARGRERVRGSGKRERERENNLTKIILVYIAYSNYCCREQRRTNELQQSDFDNQSIDFVRGSNKHDSVEI